MQSNAALATRTLPLDRLIDQVERRAGTAKLSMHRPHPRQWHTVLFRGHEDPDFVVYVTAVGDTLRDALENLLADPRSRMAA